MYRLAQTDVEALARAPSKIVFNLARIDCISAIVPRPIAHETDAVRMRPPVTRGRNSSSRRQIACTTSMFLTQLRPPM